MVISSKEGAVIFLMGCLGGLLGELSHWYQLRESGNYPDYAKKAIYWIVTLGMILAGGGLAVAYGIKDPNAILIINIGLSAPLIIKALSASVPSSLPKGLLPGQKPPATLHNFLSGR